MTYCIEPLARNQTAFVNTVQEAAEIVRPIGNPALRTMIDCSAAGAGRSRAGRRAGAALAAERADRARAFQRSEPARARAKASSSSARSSRRCATAATPGNAAIEPFVYQPDGPTCAARGIGYIRGIMETPA